MVLISLSIKTLTIEIKLFQLEIKLGDILHIPDESQIAIHFTFHSFYF